MEQFTTIVAEVEATVNTRPLAYVASDSCIEGETITPNHFLSPARSMFSPNDAQLAGDEEYLPGRDPVSTVKSLQKKQQSALEVFWHSWRTDYLLALRSRLPLSHRRQQTSANQPEVGDIVVIKNDQLPRGLWKLGKITELPESSIDDQVRCARVQTSNSILSRPLNHLFPLEVSAPPQVLDTPDQPKDAGPEPTMDRPRRQAAAIAQRKLTDAMNEEHMTVGELHTGCPVTPFRIEPVHLSA